MSTSTIQEVKSITVNRKADEVFAFLTDPSNIPRWSAAITDVEPLAPGQQIAVGTRLRAKFRVLGLNLTVQGEVTALQPERRHAVLKSTIPGGGTVESRLTVEPLDGASIVSFDERVTPPKWALDSGLSKVLISRVIETVTHSSVSNIRTLLESAEFDKLWQAKNDASTARPAESI